MKLIFKFAEQVDLSQFPGDSEPQQAEILRIADRDAFNWGYANAFLPLSHPMPIVNICSNIAAALTASVGWHLQHDLPGALQCDVTLTPYVWVMQIRSGALHGAGGWLRDRSGWRGADARVPTDGAGAC